MSIFYPMKDRSGEPLEQQYTRVSARRLKGWLVAAATAACASGAVVGGTGLAASTDEDKKPIGVFLLFAGAALGIGGGSYSALRIARDSKALKDIQKAITPSNDPKIFSHETVYQMDPKTGKYETFGHALNRVKKSEIVNGVAGLISTVGGIVSLGDSLINFRDPALSMVMTRATNDLASGRSLAFMTEFMIVPIVAGGIAALTFNKAVKAGGAIPKIEADVQHFGVNGRKRSSAKGTSPTIPLETPVQPS